jgi:hypothetical protein
VCAGARFQALHLHLRAHRRRQHRTASVLLGAAFVSYPVRGSGVVQEVVTRTSRVERALAGWLVEQPARVSRPPVAALTRQQKAAELVLGLGRGLPR